MENKFDTFTVVADPVPSKTEWSWYETPWMYIEDETGEWWVNRKTFERRPYDPEVDS
jgi:hypothetical protein